MADLAKKRGRLNKRIVRTVYPNAHAHRVGSWFCIKKGVGLDLRISGWHMNAHDAWVNAADGVIASRPPDISVGPSDKPAG